MEFKVYIFIFTGIFVMVEMCIVFVYLPLE